MPASDKAILRTAADASAYERIHAVIRKQSRQSAVPAAVRIEHGFLYDGILLDFVNLKMLGMPEMLKNLSVFIRYRNFHTNLRFPMICILYSMTETSAAAPAFRSVIFANHVVAAADLKALSVDERVRDLFSRRAVVYCFRHMTEMR